MPRARNWRDVRADALEEGRITEQGVASAGRGQGALGGVLRVTADFGDEVLILDGPQFGDDPAEQQAPRRCRAS